MPDVLVVGGTFREVLGRPKDQEPEIRLAGSALTAAIAASRFAVSVAIASFVGSEDAASAYALLEHGSVDPCLVVLDGASGTFAYAADADAEDPRPLYRPAETCPTALPTLPDARVLLVFGVPDFDPVGDPAVRAVAATATTLIWDRQGWLSRTRNAAAAAALETPDKVLLANVGEAIDEDVLDPQTGEVRLPSEYQRGVVKDGVRGTLVMESATEYSLVPAYPTQPMSTVGSGDLLGGAVAARLAAEDDLVSAVHHASAATSVVLASGDIFAPPDLWELTQKVLAEDQGQVGWRWPLPN